MSKPHDPKGAGKQPKVAVRWWLVALFLLLGAVCVHLGKMIAYAETALRSDAASFWSGVCVNVGTSLLLAALLVWFERVIVRQVRTENALAVSTAAEKAAEDAANRVTEAITPRLDELDEKFNASAGSAASGRLAAAERVATLPTFESTREGLVAARDINAIAGGDGQAGSARITVPAGASPSSPRIQITFHPATDDAAEFLDVAHISGEFGMARGTWDQGVAAETVFAELAADMTRHGQAEAAHSMSPEAFFANLSSVLLDSVSARQKDDGAWMSGATVLEMITNGWVTTKAGVEVKDHGVVVPASSFGSYVTGTNQVKGEELPPNPPPGLDQEAWDLAITRSGRLVRGKPFHLHKW
ncbi:hypothetical protein [Agromyces sp. Leaf222]|uniref:hypothetical protein n=1 Tax=Agromyces sp. Leaf222 TaxID=1735688 RepID=UPI000A89BAAE|nr:hypothetical protein [Agromyces sp. Leaf222]